MATEAIAAQGLVRFYDDHLAVDGVSLEVFSGEVVGLLGPNGAGKTTLLRMLAGVLRPNQGKARILGLDVTEHPLEAKRRLGFLSGDTALYGRLTAREVLRYFGALSGLEGQALDARIAVLAERFGLSPFLDAPVGALSSGQKQRTNLARAFVADPPVLILDEPTTGLDVISGRFVHEAIGAAKDAGKAVLLSTHQMSEAEALCDRIALLVHGRIRGLGTRAALLEESGTHSLADLIVRLHEEAPE